MVEHLTADQEVPGSNPSAPFIMSQCDIWYCYASFQQAKHFVLLSSTDVFKKITGIYLFFYFEKVSPKGGIAQW